jgi:ribose 5-phosphate isomerase A
LSEKYPNSTIKVRQAIRKAGPVITDNGNFLLDVIFPDALMLDPKQLELELAAIPGIIECGLFNDIAKDVFISHFDRVEHHQPSFEKDK